MSLRIGNVLYDVLTHHYIVPLIENSIVGEVPGERIVALHLRISAVAKEFDERAISAPVIEDRVFRPHPAAGEQAAARCEEQTRRKIRPLFLYRVATVVARSLDFLGAMERVAIDASPDGECLGKELAHVTSNVGDVPSFSQTSWLIADVA